LLVLHPHHREIVKHPADAFISGKILWLADKFCVDGTAARIEKRLQFESTMSLTSERRSKACYKSENKDLL
jgi:hypothetical protein